MRQRRMFLRMIAASLGRRKSRVAIAFVALVTGVAITSGLFGVYYDVGQKMSRELRAYGANWALAPSSPEEQPYLDLEQVSDIASRVDRAKLVGYYPYLYGLAAAKSQDIVVVGTRLNDAQNVNPYWKITGGPGDGSGRSPSALVGEAAAASLGIAPGDRLALTAAGSSRSVEVVVGGILTTGGSEDNQVFMDIELAGELFNRPGQANVAYFSIVGSLQELQSLSDSVQEQFPETAASPIKRLSQSEGKVLSRIRSLVFLAVGLVLVLTLLCVAITMMSLAMERRKEIGLRKVLGAQDRDILIEFLAEGGVLGLAGGLLGWALGVPFAQIVGQSVFNSSITVRPQVLPLALVLSAALAAAATIIPARQAAGVDPATTLRGE